MEVGRTASARAEAVEAASRKLIFETVLSDDKARFARGKDDLSDETKAAIDTMVAQLKSQKAAIWVEIEGHTDNTGDAAFNQALGLARAEAVKRYLYEQHQVPLHKMNAISFGEEKPVMDNKTRDNRDAEPPRGHQGARVRAGLGDPGLGTRVTEQRRPGGYFRPPAVVLYVMTRRAAALPEARAPGPEPRP